MPQSDNEKDSSASESQSYSFARKVWVTVGIVTAVFIILFLLWVALKEILAIFAGILLAVLLHGISRWLGNHSFLPRKLALLLTVAVLFLLFLAASFSIVPNVARQSDLLGEQLRASVNTVETALSGSAAGQLLLDQITNWQSITENGPSLLSQASSIFSIFSTTLDTLVRGLIVLFVGFYLAYEPHTYINGLVKLFPRSRRARYRETLDKTAYALRWWLTGRLASMTIVGVFSIIGLTLLDVPLAFILGLLAGLLAFIPLLGPALALIPPVLIAFTASPQKALYVFLLYLGIQFVESYFLTPVIQRRVTSLPPVLLIGSQVILGLFAGLLGVMMAAPLSVIGMVMVKMLYVEDVLHDHSVAYLEDSHSEQKDDTPREDSKSAVSPQTSPK